MLIKKYKAGSGTFHYNTDPGKNKRKLRNGRSMSDGRIVRTSVSLLIGGFVCYCALHYVPAYVNTAKIISLSNIDIPTARSTDESQSSTVSAYSDLFNARRTYFRSGQSILVEYNLPNKANLNLKITACQRVLLFEIFKCIPKNTQTIRIQNETTGTQKFTFETGGFFEFNDTVIRHSTRLQPYEVIWRRS